MRPAWPRAPSGAHSFAVRALGVSALLLSLASGLALTACGWAAPLRSVRKETSASTTAFVAGGGTISTSTVVLGPYGPVPVSGVSVGPGGTTVYEGTPIYGRPGYGTYTRCTGAAACGASTEVTVEAWGTR